MNPSADLVLNLLSFAGVGAYVVLQLGARDRSPVETRLTALFALLLMLAGVRSAHWAFGMESLRHVEEAIAAVTPLFALFVAEGLVRRHAPLWAKLGAAIGGAIFLIAAIARPDSFATPFAMMLGGFIALSLFGLIIMMWTRARDGLAVTENDAISALTMGLVLATPLTMMDFFAAAGQAPIRGGGLALLVIVFAVVRLSAGGSASGGGRAALGDFVWVALAAAAGFTALVIVIGVPSRAAGIAWFAMITSFILVAQIVQKLRDYRESARQRSFWQALAEAPVGDLDSFLGAMRATRELDHARMMEGADWKDYDVPALLTLFKHDPVITTREAGHVNNTASEQLMVLFDEHEANHAVLLSSTPPRLLLVNIPSVAATADAELHLALLAKLAAQIGGARAGTA